MALFGPLYLIWSYLVHSLYFSPIQFILSISVLVGSLWFIWSIPSDLVHSVHFDPIQSNLVLFSPHWFYSVHCVYFSHIRFILSNSVLFGPIWSYSVHYDPCYPLQSYSVHFGPLELELLIFIYLFFNSL